MFLFIYDFFSNSATNHYYSELSGSTWHKSIRIKLLLEDPLTERAAPGSQNPPATSLVAACLGEGELVELFTYIAIQNRREGCGTPVHKHF